MPRDPFDFRNPARLRIARTPAGTRLEAVLGALPSGCELVGAREDATHHPPVLLLTVRHSTFPVVPPGEPIPTVEAVPCRS